LGDIIIMREILRQFFDDVRARCPGTEILTDEEDRLAYSHGCYPREYKWILQGKYPHVTEGVLIPSDEGGISGILRIANERGIGIIPYGGGSGIVGGTIPYNGQVIVDTKMLTGFSINKVNMTARGGAGLSGCEFENLLNCHGYTSGHYPQSFQSACLGGMVATRAIGTFSTKYGKMDDMVTAIDAVLPNGEILRTHEAPKRSTGPELVQLFLGSEGVYGIVTSVEMRIYPVAEKRIFAAYTFPSTEDGLSAVRAIVHRGLRPAVVRLYDETEAEHKVAQYRFELGSSLLILVFEGYAEETDLEARLSDEICRAHLGRSKGGTASEEWLASRFSTKKMLDYDAIRGGTSDAIEVAAPWDRIAAVWRGMRDALEPMCDVVDCHFSHVYHSGASVYVIFHATTGGDDREGEKRYLECLKVACETSVRNGGNISHHHGVGTAKAEFMALEHGASGVGIMKKIKDALDPNGILNKGVLGL
jgi:alkyldihydroxyacetonephosphate synthase